ncbi:MAG: hypothetical protein GKR88_19575 [Flavobacteriaceae bacterium]|nr:MAG: hypothetical protein GKR88_19575 [Flavobacteriaceae bacterium]
MITNKAGKGKRGSLVAIVATTQSERVIEVLRKIPSKDRYLVEEITLDMAPTMEKIAKKAFPKATQVTDRFHVQKRARWYDKVEKSEFSKSFGTVARSIQSHYRSILNFFDNRSTNASAESFNAKIKAFRLQFRGVRSVPFFLFRLSKIYA